MIHDDETGRPRPQDPLPKVGDAPAVRRDLGPTAAPDDGAPPAVSVRGLDLRYGRTPVLRGVDLDVPAGSVTALLGTNGVGKTSLLRALCGELRVRAERLSVLGLDPRRRRRAVLRRVGWLPERIELPRWMRVRDHLRLRAPFYPTWSDAEARRLLGLFELDPARRWNDLSKGQRMLAGLVGVLASGPELLLLDEPFSGLDARARRMVFDGVLEHLRDEARTVLVVSHSLADVERCADRVVVLEAGRVRVERELEELRRRAVRLEVTLDDPEPAWTPPGRPEVERRDGDRLRLFYLDLDDAARTALEADPRVRRVEDLPRDLEDVLLAVDARVRADRTTAEVRS